MVWKITKDLEMTYEKRFALIPTEIDGYMVWLSPYYKTWDYTNITYGYIPRLFIYEKDVINYIEKKRREHR